MTISAEDLRTVDVEIRPLIKYLNDIPYVQTLFSCAGYGPAGEGWRHPNEIPSSDPGGHNPDAYGYIFLYYKGPKKVWSKLNEAISQNVDEVKRPRKVPWHPYPNRFVYELDPDGIGLPAKWARLFEAVRQAVEPRIENPVDYLHRR